jgi:hypothetical protein
LIGKILTELVRFVLDPIAISNVPTPVVEVADAVHAHIAALKVKSDLPQSTRAEEELERTSQVGSNSE